jgi:hypothetical protein
MKTLPTIRVVTATEAKNRFGDLTRSAYLRNEHLIVKRDGIPVMAIVPILDYQRAFGIHGLTNQGTDGMAPAEPSQEEIERMSLSEYLQVIHERIGLVDVDEAERDILEAIKEVRANRRKAKADDSLSA